MDGGQLADRSFAAALFYDEDAPRAIDSDLNTNFSGPSSHAEWTLTFSSAISSRTVNEDALCVTEENGRCVVEGMTSTIPVISVATEGDSPTTLTMVVDQTNDLITGGPQRSIEFRRNAIQGADNFKVVEDYQPALRDVMEIQRDDAGAMITVARVNSDGSTASGNLVPRVVNDVNSYVMYFEVSADEDVESLDDINSYQLQSVSGMTTASVASATGSIHSGEGSNTSVILRYVVPVSSALANVDYFTLARGNEMSLLDVADNPPVDAGNTPVAAGGIITDSAQARRDMTAPSITVVATVMPSSSGLAYDVTFEISSGSDAIPTIANAGAYTVTQNGGNATGNVIAGGITGVTANDIMTTATITYRVAFDNTQYDDVRDITGWTLNPTASQLVDLDGNLAEIGDEADRTADRDITRPQITIAGTPTATTQTNSLTYDVTFVVDATESVATLGTTASYQLYRSVGGADNRISNAVPTINVVPTIEVSNNNDRTTLTYVVTFNNMEEVTDTESFGLYRASDNISLLDGSGNLPVDGDDNLIDIDDEIDPTRRAIPVIPTLSGDATLLSATFRYGENEDMVDNMLEIADPPPSIITVPNVQLSEYTTQVEITLRARDDKATILTASSFQDAFVGRFSEVPRGEPLNRELLPDNGNSATFNFLFVVRAENTTLSPVYLFTIERPSNLANIISITVTEPISNRSILSSGGDPTVTTYTASARSNEEQVSITISPSAGAEFRINGGPVLGANNRNQSQQNLGPAGTTTTFSILVTSQDRTTTRTYALLIGREAPPPTDAALTVAAVGAEGMEAVPSADNGNQYTMTFRVASTKAIDDIGTTTSYVLLHIATEGDEALDDINSFITSSTVAVNDDNTQSTLTYVVTFTNTVTQTRITDGFTLGRNGASALQDDDGLDPVKGGTTNNGGAIEDGVRIDDDDTAVAARDTDAPAITVASSTIEPSNAGRTYTLAFAVAATEAVASIGSTSSYVLLSTVSSGVAIDFSSVSGVATANAANTTATVMYTVMLDDYADVRRVSGFSLGRRDASALLDASNNEPVKGGGTSGAGAIEAGERIDDDDTTALALRDTTGVTITIDAANVVATTPGLMYTVTYELSAGEAIAALADMGAYEVTRNGSGNEPTGSITLEVMANDDMTTAIITYSAEFGSDQYADVRTTTGWTLGLSSDAFIDAFGNEATLAGNATALRDTDAPQITIESASLSVENTTFTAIFVVEANENVETLDEAVSYALYRYVGGVASLGKRGSECW